ncbi:MAG TPA: hypothetical protein EYQ60_13050 [Myxococcales bacterium]|nr:hypothetical protein [Myxococcales bacterium]HIK83680.1 hypothetical protein [Myxococcales bacterium]
MSFRSKASPSASVSPSPDDSAESKVSMSSCEVEVFGLVAKGFSFLEVAELLHLAKHMIRTHVRRRYEKLEVSSKGAAVDEAVNLGIMSMD